MAGWRGHRIGRGMAIAAVALVATGCPGESGSSGVSTTTSVDPVVNRPPVVASFAATRPSSPSPLTTAFTWNVFDPDGQSLTCSIDVGDDGSVDRTVPGCTSSSTRSITVTGVGTTPVRLTVSDGLADTAATTSVSVGAAAADTFEVTLRFNGMMTPSQQAAFTSAAARWSQVIRSGLPSGSLSIPADGCGTGAPALSTTIDDVYIDATIAPIDGVGSVLGQAGPCWVRTSGGLPLYGAMKFDTADVANLEAAGDFGDVILHEMGHVLGLGTVWSGKGLSGGGTANPVFTGPVAGGAWQAIGGTGPVPVENSGGPGTVDSHWRESVFDGELMTGYIDHLRNPLSAVTIGALSDLGYGVDLGAADAYGLPSLRVEGPDADPGTELHTDLITPIGAA